jgi:hypothetical protein
LHLLPKQIDRKQHRYNDEYGTEEVVSVAITGHILSKDQEPHNAIPRECNREIQLYEPVLALTGFEKKPPSEQNGCEVENDLSGPDMSTIGF